MRHHLAAPAHGPAPLAVPHLVPLAGEWALWRDIAVRTAGFPVSGLDIFGSPDEQAGLRAVARDPLFQTAVTWQNRAAMHNAVGKIAGGAAAPGSRQRQREEVVASYWQRYCAKNDTIGFFGPLAWGCASDDGPAIHAAPRSAAGGCGTCVAMFRCQVRSRRSSCSIQARGPASCSRAGRSAVGAPSPVT